MTSNDLLHWILEDFWRFVGAWILVSALSDGVAKIVRAARIQVVEDKKKP
jgi:hypothetical protein